MKRFSLLTILFFLGVLSLKAVDQVLSFQKREVTVSEYCSFLNDVAATDSCFLWKNKMGSSSVGGLIIQLGNPGNYKYQVVSGCEGEVMHWTSELDERSYTDWLATKEISNEEDHFLSRDPSLASNEESFYLSIPNATVLSLDTTTSTDPQPLSWTREDTVVATLLGGGLVWLFGEPYCRSQKPYEDPGFLEQDRDATQKYIQAHQDRSLSLSPAEKVILEPTEEQTQEMATQLSYINEVLTLTKNLQSRIEPFATADEAAPLSEEQFNELLNKYSWKGPSSITRGASSLSRNICCRPYPRENDGLLVTIQSSIQTEIAEPLGKFQKVLETHPLSVYEEKKLDLILANSKKRFYQARQIEAWKKTSESTYTLPWKEIVNTPSDLQASLEKINQELLKANQLVTEMETKHEEIQRRLAFIRSGEKREELEKMGQLLLNLRSAKEAGKKRSFYVLKKTLENRVKSLECDQRIAELEEQNSSTETQQKIETYRQWKQDLEANPGLRLTRLNYLWYALEQDGMFFPTDLYGMAPGYTRWVGVFVTVGCFVIPFLPQTIMNDFLNRAAFVAILLKSFGLF